MFPIILKSRVEEEAQIQRIEQLRELNRLNSIDMDKLVQENLSLRVDVFSKTKLVERREREVDNLIEQLILEKAKVETLSIALEETKFKLDKAKNHIKKYNLDKMYAFSELANKARKVRLKKKIERKAYNLILKNSVEKNIF